jgi:uncharacterized protein (UPF0332 family)
VTPEAAEHLDKARDYLAKARALIDVLHYADEAGRAAYLAGFHAAQAFIIERTGKVAKTHEGVHSQFNRLARNDPRFDLELRRFLSRTYDLKATADYLAGPGSTVSVERAEGALTTAMRLVECIARTLP